MNIFAMMIKDKQPNGIKVLDDVTGWQNLQFLCSPDLIYQNKHSFLILRRYFLNSNSTIQNE